MKANFFANATPPSSHNFYGFLESSVTSTGTQNLVDVTSETLRELFDRLVESWMDETEFTNSMTDILDNRHLNSIISMGPAVVPLILRDLSAHPKPWFHALRLLTGVDPVPPMHSGNLQKMRADWLEWGAQNGYQI